MRRKGPFDEPSEVEAEDAEVIVDGPDGVAITMTPKAALETSDRLLNAGLKAQGQKVEKEARTRGPEFA